MSNLIYIADDDIVTLRMVQALLEREGFQVECFETGDLLYEAFRQKACDLIILDVLMPGNDGFTIGAKIRQISGIPIIMLTGQDSDTDYIFGISIGFDVYLTKPFNPAKLMAHIRALLIKSELNKNAQVMKQQADITYADITMHPNKLTAYCNNKEFHLTNIEFGLLLFMFENKERAIPRGDLLNKLWGLDSSAETRVVDDTLKRLRRKLAQVGSQVSIDTVRGFGFKLSTKTDLSH